MNELIPTLRRDAAVKTYLFEIKRAENVTLSPVFNELIAEEDVAGPMRFSQFEDQNEDLTLQFDEYPPVSQELPRAVTPPLFLHNETNLLLSVSQTRKRRGSEDDQEGDSKKRKLSVTTSSSQNLEVSPQSKNSNKKLLNNLFLCEDNNANDEDFEL